MNRQNSPPQRTIGLLGGMSWESTATYYRLINEEVKRRLGGLHSAKIVLYSVDFAPIEALQQRGDWEKMGHMLGGAARSIEAAGADFLLICTNTMHRVAPQVEREITIPLLHIADATAAVLAADSTRTVGLLGTAFTMEQDFYLGRLRDRHGLHVLVPEEQDRRLVHDVIFNELCLGHRTAESRQHYLRIITELAERGAEAVILGCTEIGMLINQTDTTVRLLDTTAIHAVKAVDHALPDS